MRHLVLVALLSILANLPTCAQEPCNYRSENPFDAMAKDLSQAKTCSAAAAKMRDCAWGSSADTQLAPIVIEKCEKTFLPKLSPAAQKRYADEMQLCAYEYARQEGTIYMSAAAPGNHRANFEFAAGGLRVNFLALIAEDRASSHEKARYRKSRPLNSVHLPVKSRYR